MTLRRPSARHVPLLLTLLSSLVLLVLAARIPQGVSYDPSWQLKALQQYLNGESPSPNHLVTPRTDDLSQDEATWIHWWAPGTALLAYPLVASGLSEATAVRLIAGMCVLVGSFGWTRWVSLFGLPAWISILLAASLPWIPYASNAVILYAPEALVFAAAPWMLLATYGLRRRWQRGQGRSPKQVATCALLGLGLGFAYVLKYSAAFVSAGALLYLVFTVWRTKSLRRRAIGPLACVAAASALPIIALTSLNQMLAGSANLVSEGAAVHLRWESLLHLLANPALAMGGGDSILRFLLLHAGVDPAAGELWIGLVGLPGGVLLIALMLRHRAADGPGLLSFTVVLASTIALFVVWAVSSNVSYDGRHLASASIASMPLALQQVCHWWRRWRPVVRPLLVGAGFAYIGLPLSIAGLLVAGAAIQAPTGYVAGPSGIYNPLLATADLVAARAALLQDYNPATDVWYLPDPVTALDLPGRAIVDDVALTRVPVLSAFQSSQPVRVRALLPPEFEQNGLGDRVRAAFVGTTAWSESPVNGSRYVIWTTIVAPIRAEGAGTQPVAARVT